MPNNVENAEDNILFSVIVPVYNVEDTLSRCVDSLIMQTEKNIEIILIDDGSTDSSGFICENYASDDARIKVIHKANGGLSEARNWGMDLAVGNFIMYVDSDDYIDLDACECLGAFCASDIDIIVGDAYVEGGSSGVLHPELGPGYVTDGVSFMKTCYRSNAMPPAVWLNVYRNNFLKQRNLAFKPGVLHEDIEFTPRTFFYAKKVCYSSESFYHYVIRDGSIMKSNCLNRNFNDVYSTCLELEAFFEFCDDVELKTAIMNDLAGSYLYRFKFVGDVKSVSNSIDRSFVLRNSKSLQKKMKSILFAISPVAYRWFANRFNLNND